MSAAAAARRRKHKADRYRGAQLAPAVPIEPVVCRCSHARLLHGEDGRCVNRVCGCTEYRERGECGGC